MRYSPGDEARPRALWKEAARYLDWSALETASDTRNGRACGDPETAARLEAPVDARYLRRDSGRLWLDLDPEWRIGATAMRLIALAESRGSRFRDLAQGMRLAGTSSCPNVNVGLDD